MKSIIFIDTEVGIQDQRVHDYGAVGPSEDRGPRLRTGSSGEFHRAIQGAEYLCGHNIVDFDSRFIQVPEGAQLIDTLYLSPLLFPNKPYHRLLKDDKLQTDQLNDPLNDAVKARELFYDEVNAFAALDEDLRLIYFLLLGESPCFSGFFSFLDISLRGNCEEAIRRRFKGDICDRAPLEDLISAAPLELAYCLALCSATEEYSLIPRWVQVNFPRVDQVMTALRGTSCGGCAYCRSRLDPVRALRKYFGYPGFRSYGGVPLQEDAVRAAVEHKSLLAIFPTGGGKSLTFQIPALMAGETCRGLTVVISPLQSLMKDQVDNLELRGIAQAVTINGLLSPIERAEAIERVESGLASIVYISPESLRSSTIERLFLSRHIDRFVIDEAHCFSAWGQDFRVDYLYIGDFIRSLQERKGPGCRIPVSCFTATAKQKVISDIKDYFMQKLGLELELFATDAARTNLRYEVLYKETDGEKYEALRDLIERKNCPTIVYVSRVRRTLELAQKLERDGFSARPFNGRMDSSEKQAFQEAFKNDRVQVIVATSAFGMGVDKSNVGLVVHYDISDSLENYVQEAGRAGRSEELQAECYVLFNDGDLDKHFILLNQTKLSISEIQQVWKAIKDLSRHRPQLCCSPLEIARQAGWDDSIQEAETRVKTAILALENAGYVRRGRNMPRVYADSITVRTMTEASARIGESQRFRDDKEKTLARRIISQLISCRSISQAENRDPTNQVDYLADILGAERLDIVKAIQVMREEGLLADHSDQTAYIQRSDTVNRSLTVLRRAQALEAFLLDTIEEDRLCSNYKELNEAALAAGIKTSSVNAIKTIFFYWTIRGYISKEQDQTTGRVEVTLKLERDRLRELRQRSCQVAELIIDHLFRRGNVELAKKDETLVSFSLLELKNICDPQLMFDVTQMDVVEALLFMAKIGALRLQDGFVVFYGAIQLERLVMDNRIKYKQEDYRQLDEFYKQKIQQIHIVGEYANMMVRDKAQATQFVADYFRMDYKKFIAKYFAGERAAQIQRNITPGKYSQLFDSLSERQLSIIRDDESRHIVVCAGPGSGKTRVLVHKLASLLLMEDVKHEQLLMLTFSRAAAMEFKQRLRELIGGAAFFIEIKTFHSFCFDLLGKVGSLQESENIVRDAGELIRSGDVDLGRITRTVLVIDEAQDMDRYEFALVEALMERNEEMRVIAVGDDDQNIYQFRGSDPRYLRSLIEDHGAVQYSLVDNYRSSPAVVRFSNRFVRTISDRMKTEDIRAVNASQGQVRLVKHLSGELETAIVEDLLARNAPGSSCILTSTNQEALLVLGILKQRGVPAKLIQSMDGFDLYDLAEIRYFLKVLDQELTSPVIAQDQWVGAIGELCDRYQGSACLPLVLSILTAFARTGDRKYRTDLELFFHESRLEDFFQTEQGHITVSTMHKAKGREFDNVYLLLNDADPATDEEKRKIYVAMTRARTQLHIHYHGEFFDRLAPFATDFETDPRTWPKPQEVILQLTHRDVYLDFFKDKKSLILSPALRSGTLLTFREGRLWANIGGKTVPVVQLSARGNESIQRLRASGYVPRSSSVRFICAWKGKEDTQENAVLLADIFLRREESSPTERSAHERRHHQ